MNSRERANEFFDSIMFSSRPKEMELADFLDTYASEARAEQREACAKKAVSKIQSPLMQKVVSDACLNAVEKSDG